MKHAAAPTTAHWKGGSTRRKFVVARTSSLASTEGGVGAAAGQSGETELTGMRTQTSRTFAEPDGTRRLVAATTPMNYRDSSGNWQRIDDTLIADSNPGFAWQNTADSYTVEFPSDLSGGPIRVTTGGQWVAFQLEGAKSPAQVSGNTVTYANALPGVTLTYAALPTGLKETLTLADASAPSSFTFDVTTSAGLSTTSNASGVSYGTSAKQLLALVRPWAIDATGNDQTLYQNATLAWSGNGAHAGTATVTLRQAWLTAAATQYPITVDPTLSPTGTQITDCHLSSGGPDNNLCSMTSVKVGTTTTDIRRTLMQFDVSSIPGDATVLDADAQLYLTALDGTPTSLPIQAIQNCTAWTSAATWNTPNGTANWTGGDACHDPLWTTTVSGTNSWYHWHITSLAQTWVNQGPATDHVNDGFMLERSDNTSALATFNSSEASSNTPSISVYYTAGAGGENNATYLPFNLTGHSTLGVNPASGNLMLTTQDLNVRGTGLSYNLSHVYNSRLAGQQLSSGADTYPGEGLSPGWTTSVGDDVFLRIYGSPAGAVAMRMADGGWIRFTRDGGNNSWSTNQTASPGVNATLDINKDGAGNHRVVFHNSGLNYWFTETSSGTIRDATLQKITDKHGQAVTINRSSSPGGPITGVTDTHNRTFTYTHTNGSLSQVSDPVLSRSVSFTPDNANRLGTFTDANSENYTYGYNPTSNLLTSITTPGNRSISFDYDSAGRIYHIYRSTASSASNGDSCTPGTTNTWTFSYGAPDGGAPSGALGEMTLTDPTSAVTKYYYDAQRHVIRVKDAQGRNRDTTYTPDTGMAASYTDNLNNSFTMGYNANRNLNKVTGPAESGGQNPLTVKYGYGSSYGDQTQPSSYTDPQGNVTTYGQDLATGDITSTTAADNTNVQMHYNNNGTLDTVTDPAGSVTQYNYYDGTVNSGRNQGDLKSIQTPGPQGDQQFTYDGDSRLQTSTDGAGKTATNTYDNLDRLTKVTYGDGSYVQYTYDNDDNVISRRDTNGNTTTITYDGYNRPVTTHEPWHSPSVTDSFCYDANSRLTQLTDAGGTVGYTYNNAGDLMAVTEPGGSNCATYTWTGTLPPANSRCIIFGYDSDGHRIGTAYPGGVQQTLSYFNDGQIQEINTTKGSTTLDDLSYNYNQTIGGVATQTAQRQKVTDHVRSNTITYGYDQQNRLTSANNVETSGTTTKNYSYTYGARNRTSQTAGSTTTQYSYDNDNELCRTKTGTTALSGCTFAAGDATDLKYDGAGNLTDTGTNGTGTGQLTATYNAAGQTTSMTDLTGANGTAMTYNDAGQNLRAQAGTTAFTNTILGLATSTDNSGTLTSYTRDPQGHLLSYRVGNTPSSSTNHYYLLDSIGTVLGTTDATGTQDANYYYDPFGLGTNQTGTAAANNPFRFASGYLDTTGWYHFGQRYYNPTLARWSQADPMAGSIDAPKDINRYLYAGDDPVNMVDLLGTTTLYGAAEEFTSGVLAEGGAAIGEVGGLLIGSIEADTGVLAAVALGVSGLGLVVAGIAVVGLGVYLFSQAS